MNSNDRMKLKRFIKNLQKYKGKHTEFVSVYIPKGYSITSIIKSLQDEQGTATNIKDKANSKAVIQALERMIRGLRTFKQTPENGLAIFSGNVSEKENVNNFQLFYVEPPEELKLKLYRCENRFILEPLEEMSFDDTTYGLLVIDKSEATLGILVGTSIKVIRTFHSSVPGKFKTGGQSAQRFARIREGEAILFYKRVADHMIKEFTYMEELKGIVIGGPGITKQNFFEGDFLNQEIKKKVLGLKDMTYTNKSGLYELFEKCQDLLADSQAMEEKKIIDEYFEVLSKEQNKIVYGIDNTRKALEMSAVETFIILEEVVDDLVMEELLKLCEDSGANIKLLSNKTQEAIRYKGLSGIGGILRFPID